MSKLKVLLIDDIETITRELGHMLRQYNMEVETANAGDEALKKIKASLIKGRVGYDAIVCDLVMPPGIDGIEVLQKTLEMDRFACVIMMTAQGSIETAVQALHMGAHDYSAKPPEIHENEFILNIKRGAAFRKIARIRHKVLRTSDKDVIFDLIDDAIRSLFNIEEYFLALFSYDDDSFEVITPKGNLRNEEISSRGFAKQVLENGERIIERSLDAARKSELNPILEDAKSLLAQPLKMHEHFLGLLEVESKRENAFTDFDISTIEMLADEASIALYHIFLKKREASLVGDFTHAAKTPVWNITALAEGILYEYGNDLPSRVDSGLRDILLNAERVRRAISISLNNIRDNEKVVPLTQLLDNFQSHYKTSPAVNFDLRKCKNKEGRSIHCSPLILEQALNNIMDNAEQAANESKSPPAVTCEIGIHEDTLVISIEDNGPGIASPIKERLFAAYNSSRLEQGGSGLGLYLSKKVISKLKGTLHLESTSSKGTIFEITLPLVQNEKE